SLQTRPPATPLFSAFCKITGVGLPVSSTSQVLLEASFSATQELTPTFLYACEHLYRPARNHSFVFKQLQTPLQIAFRPSPLFSITSTFLLQKVGVASRFGLLRLYTFPGRRSSNASNRLRQENRAPLTTAIAPSLKPSLRHRCSARSRASSPALGAGSSAQ